MTIVEYGSRGAIRLRDLIYLRNAIALFLARGDGVEIFALSLTHCVCASWLSPILLLLIVATPPLAERCIDRRCVTRVDFFCNLRAFASSAPYGVHPFRCRPMCSDWPHAASEPCPCSCQCQQSTANALDLTCRVVLRGSRDAALL